MPQILVEELSKTYRVAERQPGALGALKGLVHRRWQTIEALRNVSFQIGQGELVGLIGPNGAGKSTTIKILSGIMQPSSGRCEVDGLTPWRQRIKHVGRIGVVFGQRSQLWWDLPVIDGFDLLRDIYRVPQDRYAETRDELVALLRLERLLSRPVRQLSLGQRMRCEIAAAMLHEPRLLFLDEPTIGLDAPSKLAVRDFVGRLNRERGVTVILTTHDMHDIEALAERVIVIGGGRIMADGSFATLRAGVQEERRLFVEFAGAAPMIAMPEVRLVEREGRKVELAFDPRRIAAADLIGRLVADHPVEDIRIEEPLIEKVMARFYAQHGAGDA